MNPKYQDPKMEEYFRSLPEEVQNFIIQSGAEIASPGELTMIGEHFKNNFKADNK